MRKWIWVTIGLCGAVHFCFFFIPGEISQTSSLMLEEWKRGQLRGDNEDRSPSVCVCVLFMKIYRTSKWPNKRFNSAEDKKKKNHHELFLTRSLERSARCIRVRNVAVENECNKQQLPLAATMSVVRNVTAISRVILIVSHLFRRQPSDGPSYL